MHSFDRLAAVYDLLKSIVFGKNIEKATNCFLSEVPRCSKILIVGGGTGEILRQFNCSQYIIYLELSRKMLEKARSVDSKAHVEFVHANVECFSAREKFDIIITPFVLDCFTESQLEAVFLNLTGLLRPEGKWFHIDFYPKNRVQRLLVEAMYMFFNVIGSLKTKELANFDRFFRDYGFTVEEKALFFHSMMESKIYHNNN